MTLNCAPLMQIDQLKEEPLAGLIRGGPSAALWQYLRDSYGGVPAYNLTGSRVLISAVCHAPFLIFNF